MKLDLSHVAFSMAGSYLAISDVPPREGTADPAGLFLRIIRGSAENRFVGRLYPVIGGKEAAYTYSASPSELILHTHSGEIRLCFADSETILAQGDPGTVLCLDFKARNPGFSHILDVSCPDSPKRYMAVSFPNSSSFLVWTQQGQAAPDQVWPVADATRSAIAAARSAITFEGGEAGFLAAIAEVHRSWNGHCRTFEYAASRKSAEEAFFSFAGKMPSVPGRFAGAAQLSAYVMWAGYVKKSGFLLRDSMLMSKNWMCNVWSWDHCFNAMALAYHCPELAWDQLMMMFDFQDVTGALPDSVNDSKATWSFCKPPVHGWALMRMMEVMDLTAAQMAEAYEKLALWTEWWLNYRDHNGNGLCEYHHGNDSGWDNATVFSGTPPIETPDLQALLILQMEALEKLASLLGRRDNAARWKARAEKMMGGMLAHCFENGKPRATQYGGEPVPNQSLLMYLPVVLGKRLPKDIRDSLVSVLKSDTFLTAHGYATEALKSPDYAPDSYWRGPIWAPNTLLLLDGLWRLGETGLVRQVAEAFSLLVQKSGCAENFDPLTGEGLRDRAYTWTASVFFVMAHEFLRQDA